MSKFDEAIERLFRNVFVCRKCNAKVRADPNMIRAGKIKCRKCDSKKFRPKSRK